MRKRQRENPCDVCGHYHKYEEGETCEICGHRAPVSSDETSVQVQVQLSAFPSLILPEFLYLGSYDNATRSELLKAQGITRVLNTVPDFQNLYKNSFTYHCLQDDKVLQFDEAIQFLERCERDKARVLVHCMSGKNRSPAVVIAYLMKSKGWSLQQSYKWVKDRRSSVELTQAVYQQLQDYEQKVFGSSDDANIVPSLGHVPGPSIFNFGFAKANDPVPVPFPAFKNHGTISVFSRSTSEIPPHEFTIAAGQKQKSISESLGNSSGSDIPMDRNS